MLSNCLSDQLVGATSLPTWNKRWFSFTPYLFFIIHIAMLEFVIFVVCLILLFGQCDFFKYRHQCWASYWPFFCQLLVLKQKRYRVQRASSTMRQPTKPFIGLVKGNWTKPGSFVSPDTVVKYVLFNLRVKNAYITYLKRVNSSLFCNPQQVVLIVNVATYWGFNFQYHELNDLQTNYTKDLVVLGFPSNQFNLVKIFKTRFIHFFVLLFFLH